MHWHLFYADKPQRVPGMDESIRRYGILVRPPGEAYEYSNFGYGILGHILARTSGKTYADFMRKEVFEPLGMTRTMILTEPGRVDNVAAKYDAAKKELPVSDFDHQGASAAYASVHDLVRFGMFRLGDEIPGQKRILKGETLAAMRTQSGSEFLDGSTPVKVSAGKLRPDRSPGRRVPRRHRRNAGRGFQTRHRSLGTDRFGRPGQLGQRRFVVACNTRSSSAYLPAFRDTPYTPPQAAPGDQGGVRSAGRACRGLEGRDPDRSKEHSRRRDLSARR